MHAVVVNGFDDNLESASQIDWFTWAYEDHDRADAAALIAVVRLSSANQVRCLLEESELLSCIAGDDVEPNTRLANLGHVQDQIVIEDIGFADP